MGNSLKMHNGHSQTGWWITHVDKTICVEVGLAHPWRTPFQSGSVDVKVCRWAFLQRECPYGRSRFRNSKDSVGRVLRSCLSRWITETQLQFLAHVPWSFQVNSMGFSFIDMAYWWDAEGADRPISHHLHLKTSKRSRISYVFQLHPHLSIVWLEGYSLKKYRSVFWAASANTLRSNKLQWGSLKNSFLFIS